MISVIVPVYKAEKTIARCIESVIAQEYKDWELILVDDGSPDKSGEICDEYAVRNKRIRVVHQENAGASAARNRGIDLARGEYVCFIDADDYVTERYLTDFQIEEISVDFAVQGMTLTFDNKIRNHDKLPSCSGIISLKDLLSQDECTLDLLNGPCCKLYRVDILREHQIIYPVGLSYGEDSIFVLAYLCHSVSVYSRSLSNYFYTHENDLSLSSTLQDGHKMMSAVLQDYSLFKRMFFSIEKLPKTYVEYYRNYKALMFYNAIHSELLSEEELKEKISYLKCIPDEVSDFFSKSNNLPNAYKVIRFLLCIAPRLVSSLAYPWIYKIMT